MGELPNASVVTQCSINQGSVLELHARKNTTKQTRIALQLPNRKRIVENLPGSISLWEMLLYFEPQAGINIVSSPDEPYSYPILTFMNRKFSSPSAFKSATIS